MTDTVVLLSMCPDAADAERIASALVNERLAACVNILGGVLSIYHWRGKIEHANEVLLLIKTTSERASAVRERLGELHSYDTPEVLQIPVIAGAEKYLAWVRAEVSSAN